MKKFIRRVVKSFKKLNDANILTFGQNVTVSMAAAVATFPNPVPALVDINAQLVNYEGLLQTSASRDKLQIQLKNISKFALNQLLSQLADYVGSAVLVGLNKKINFFWILIFQDYVNRII